jgi:hypothetical protein
MINLKQAFVASLCLLGTACGGAESSTSTNTQDSIIQENCLIGNWKFTSGSVVNVFDILSTKRYSYYNDSASVKGGGHLGVWKYSGDTLSLTADSAFYKVDGKSYATDSTVVSQLQLEKFKVQECTSTNLTIIYLQGKLTYKFHK